MSQNICQVCNLSLTSVAFTKNIIYVVTAPVLLEVGDGCLEAPSIFILLGNLNDFIDMQKPENYIIYQSNAPGEVFTALLSKLNLESRILEAELAISRALFDCTSIKDLLDVAASILGNPILLHKKYTADVSFEITKKKRTFDLPFDCKSKIFWLVFNGGL